MSDISENEKKIIEENKAIFKKLREEEENFLGNIYPRKSIDEKVRYWVANIHKGMRYQGEAINDEYSQFSYEWYLWVKKQEPQFDELFEEVIKHLGFAFDWNRYFERIQKK